MTGAFYSVTRRKSTPRSTAPVLILAGNLLRLIIKAPTPDGALITGQAPRISNPKWFIYPHNSRLISFKPWLVARGRLV